MLIIAVHWRVDEIEPVCSFIEYPIEFFSKGWGQERIEEHYIPNDGAQMLPISKPSDRVCVHDVRDEAELCCIDDPIPIYESREDLLRNVTYHKVNICFHARMLVSNRALARDGAHSISQPLMISRSEVEEDICLQTRYAVENGTKNVSKEEGAYHAITSYPRG